MSAESSPAGQRKASERAARPASERVAPCQTAKVWVLPDASVSPAQPLPSSCCAVGVHEGVSRGGGVSSDSVSPLFLLAGVKVQSLSIWLPGDSCSSGQGRFFIFISSVWCQDQILSTAQSHPDRFLGSGLSGHASLTLGVGTVLGSPRGEFGNSSERFALPGLATRGRSWPRSL